MATAATISLTTDTAGVFHTSVNHDSASKASSMLQSNHDKWHMYFNTSGFHNHIAHHLLTIYALGATGDQIQTAYDLNASYQRPQFPVTKEVVQDMADPDKFRQFLNDERYFHDYEIFFRKEMEASSWQDVLNKHVFAETPQAKDMLARMFAGFFHPIIHLGFGVEFEQPAVIIESLGEAATHDNWPKVFLEATEARARERIDAGEKPRPLVDLINAARVDEKIKQSAFGDVGNRVRDGVLKNALQETIELCSQWFVQPVSDDLQLRTAEMTNVCALFAGASQHASRKKQIKFDFFYIHSLNSSIFFSAFLDKKHDNWLGNETRARLLMYKAWSDIAMYISRGSAKLLIDEIENYNAKHSEDTWSQLFERINVVEDDGHSSKLVRALANGERICRPYEDSNDDDLKKRFVVRNGMWSNLGHMAVDSVEGAETRWVRNCGFDSAWDKIPGRGTWPDGAVMQGSEEKGGSHVKGEGYHETD